MKWFSYPNTRVYSPAMSSTTTLDNYDWSIGGKLISGKQIRRGTKLTISGGRRTAMSISGQEFVSRLCEKILWRRKISIFRRPEMGLCCDVISGQKMTCRYWSTEIVEFVVAILLLLVVKLLLLAVMLLLLLLLLLLLVVMLVLLLLILVLVLWIVVSNRE